MKRVILSSVVVFAIFAGLAGCGGSNSSSTSSSTTVTVALSPTSASVITGATQQFTATVSNSTNTAVTWSVNGVAGGNQTVGFVSSTGLYTAPNAVPTPATVTVTAISQATTAATGSATVTITAPATPTSPLVVSPAFVNVPAGGQQTFTATVSGNPIPVNWAVNCQSLAAGACGTISAAGVFTAPASPPPAANVSVTASAIDKSVPASGAVVTVQFSNGTLNGRYAFSFSGQNAPAVSYVAAGSITFDGNGNITGGTEDINTLGHSVVTINSGTYHIGTDGRGNATVATSAGTVNWQFAVVNHTRAFVIRFDAGVPSASGTLELQDTTQFTLAGVKGNYAFNLAGANSSNKPGSLAAAGALTSNGAGAISSGVVDINSAGTASAGLSITTGGYTVPDASGHGTMTLTTGFTAQPVQTFAYYVVDATHVKVVETDAAAQLAGDMFKQASGPFSNASLKGGFAFAFLGSNTSGPLGEGGVFTLDGAGHVTTGTFDINSNGNPQNLLAVSGAYNVVDTTTGRAMATLSVGGSPLQYVFYPQASGALSVVEIDSSNTAAGRALPQPAASFSSGSLLGNYALNLSGTDFTVNPGEVDIVGHAFPNGGSSFDNQNSSVAISDNGALTPSASLSGSYQVSVSGHGSATLTTGLAAFTNATLNFYIADSSDILFLESDGTRVLVGIMQKQF